MQTSVQSITEPAAGDFGFVDDPEAAKMLKNAYDAVTAEGLWPFLRAKSSGQPFMCWDAPELRALEKHMDPMGHSGASFAYTMRQMECIAKMGWRTYAETLLSEQSVARALKAADSKCNGRA